MTTTRLRLVMVRNYRRDAWELQPPRGNDRLVRSAARGESEVYPRRGPLAGGSAGPATRRASAAPLRPPSESRLRSLECYSRSLPPRIPLDAPLQWSDRTQGTRHLREDPVGDARTTLAAHGGPVCRSRMEWRRLGGDARAERRQRRNPASSQESGGGLELSGGTSRRSCYPASRISRLSVMLANIASRSCSGACRTRSSSSRFAAARCASSPVSCHRRKCSARPR